MYKYGVRNYILETIRLKTYLEKKTKQKLRKSTRVDSSLSGMGIGRGI